MLPSTGVRLGLIILGDRLDGLERQGSNPWGSTIFPKNRILKMIVKIPENHRVSKDVYITTPQIEFVIGPYQKSDPLASPDVRNYYSSVWWVDIVPKNLKENEYPWEVEFDSKQEAEDFISLVSLKK